MASLEFVTPGNLMQKYPQLCVQQKMVVKTKGRKVSNICWVEDHRPAARMPLPTHSSANNYHRQLSRLINEFYGIHGSSSTASRANESELGIRMAWKLAEVEVDTPMPSSAPLQIPNRSQKRWESNCDCSWLRVNFHFDIEMPHNWQTRARHQSRIQF